MDKYKNNCNCSSGVVTSAQYNSASSCEEEPTQLHTVVIPATKGADGEHDVYAPTLGMWRNTIVVYQKNDAVYLYDINGVYTNLTGTDWGPQIAEAVTAAANAQSTASQAASDLQAYELEANGKLLTLANGLAAQQTALATETTNRTEADTALSDQISGLSTQVQQLGTEVGAQGTALNTAISNLENSISAETSAREAADTALQTSVDANTTAIANLEATVGSEAGGFTKELMLDLTSQAGSDTVTLTKTTGNLGTTETTETEIPLPVASATQAGVLSAEDYAAFAAGSAAGEEFTSEEKTKLDSLATITSVGDHLNLSSAGVLSVVGVQTPVAPVIVKLTSLNLPVPQGNTKISPVTISTPEPGYYLIFWSASFKSVTDLPSGFGSTYQPTVRYGVAGNEIVPRSPISNSNAPITLYMNSSSGTSNFNGVSGVLCVQTVAGDLDITPGMDYISPNSTGTSVTDIGLTLSSINVIAVKVG